MGDLVLLTNGEGVLNLLYGRLPHCDGLLLPFELHDTAICHQTERHFSYVGFGFSFCVAAASHRPTENRDEAVLHLVCGIF